MSWIKTGFPAADVFNLLLNNVGGTMDGIATEGLQADIAAALAEHGVASLDRGGAPVFIAEGDALRLVHANAAALALFGADSLADLGARVFAPAVSALAARIGAFAPGAGRIERFDFGGAPKLTFFCRRANTTEKLFVLAGLGLRPRAAPAPKFAASLARPAASDACAELKRAFERRYPDLKPARFLWRTDARNVVTEVTPPLAEIFGGAAATLVGRDLTEVARSLGMDPDGRLSTALMGRATFSGVELIWPIVGAAAAAPVSLGALPAFDREKGFDGWRGFGVIQLHRIRECTHPFASPDVAAPEAPAPDTSGVVLPFPPARGGAVVESRDEPAALVTLAPHERQAFREIARTLGAQGEAQAQADPGEADARGFDNDDSPAASAPEVSTRCSTNGPSAWRSVTPAPGCAPTGPCSTGWAAPTRPNFSGQGARTPSVAIFAREALLLTSRRRPHSGAAPRPKPSW